MATAELDPRVMEISIAVGSNIHRFSGELAIRAQGVLFATYLQNFAEVTIFNMTRQTQDFILTVTSPYTANQDPKSVTIRAGRKSYGMTEIYTGNILVSQATQPPDIGVTITLISATPYSNTAYSTSQPGLASLETITKQLAAQANAVHVYEVENYPQISNYNFSGTVTQQIAHVNQFGNLDVFLVQGTTNVLFVKGATVPLRNTLRVVSEDTGMVGIPIFTELGIKVTFLIDAKTKVGGRIRINSKRYPVFNGDYGIFKLGFDLASRDTPYYYIAEASRVPTVTGATA